ncbi:autophagy-related protein 13 homolog isoform X2 [Aethina tumida]|uniref:autophagy-related protein 13 homolog isoform X2 n=1 Tax=Aethina tumida TaxID=116153 RepID=UPI0021488797|nr:autophagy-related protein 13 homolog isoform X2 [Aethina tumida]
MKLSSAEKRELDKFSKFLALKSTQIIVQSRMGEKYSTPCKPTSTGQDWFNLNVKDSAEITEEAKKTITHDFYVSRLPLSLEISLTTLEGDKMILESWCLGLLPEQSEYSSRVISTVYNRMGMLLKSLLSVTRVLPAYKVSQRASPESYNIYYRLYYGEPETHGLGDGFKQVRVGQLCTPIGTLFMSVAYRTKMTISPTQTGKDNSIMLKSDHFNTNLSPKNYKQNDDKTSSLTETMRIGPFATVQPVKFKQYEDPDLIIPFSKLLKYTDKKPSISEENEENESKNGQSAIDENKNGKNKDDKTEEEKKEEQKEESSTSSRLTMFTTNDDFIMKTPFASTNASGELGKFYREWQTAPPLLEFTEIPPLAELDVTKQLESFESNLDQYDSLVQSLCQSPNNN